MSSSCESNADHCIDYEAAEKARLSIMGISENTFFFQGTDGQRFSLGDLYKN